MLKHISEKFLSIKFMLICERSFSKVHVHYHKEMEFKA